MKRARLARSSASFAKSTSPARASATSIRGSAWKMSSLFILSLRPPQVA